MRVGLSIVLVVVCLGLVACGDDDAATPTPASTDTSASTTNAPAQATFSPDPDGPLAAYPGAVVGMWRTVNGETFVTESGTGIYYAVGGVPRDAVFGQVIFVIGTVTPVPNVHLIQATQITTVPETGSLGCAGTLAKRDGRYFVESSAEGGCGGVEVIEGDPQKLDAKVGQETGLTVRYCTVTKEGRMVKSDLDPDFVCSDPFPRGPPS